MELTSLHIGLIAAAGSLIGVAATAWVNWKIAQNNRIKALCEWRRDKFLSQSYEFLDKFRECTVSNNRDSKQFDPNIITEMAIKNYASCDQKAFQLCLLMSEATRFEFLEKYKHLKLSTAMKTDKMHWDFVSGDHYSYFGTPEDYTELNEVISLLHNVLEEMK
ncbi:hypothetical protein JSY51_000764 [Salmonella enterica]|nr:hypothetical protein [Salmonella enterica]